MEVTFRTTQLRRCYEEQREAQRTWGLPVARAYLKRIETLRASATVQQVRTFRHLRLHKLTGAYAGQYALDLGERWRLHVTFEDGPPARARTEEVSRHYGD